MSPARGRRTRSIRDTLLPRGRHQRAARRRRRRRGAIVAVAASSRRWGVAAGDRRAQPRSSPTARRAISTRSVRSRSGGTRSCTPPTARCSGRFPAERNRQPVAAEEMSPWIRKATIAVEDRRFFEHGGVDVEGIARAAVADIKAGRDRRRGLDDHAAARPQPLHLAGAHGAAEAQGGVPRDEARRRLDEASDPHDVPEPGLLREPGVRHRGGGTDVLLEAGAGAHALASPPSSPG